MVRGKTGIAVSGWVDKKKGGIITYYNYVNNMILKVGRRRLVWQGLSGSMFLNIFQK
jgi:hypothetical protein